MRILVIADIHGNWPALEAIASKESFDCCWCLGDIVDYGPFGAECVDWVREHCQYVVRGNHDHAVAQFVNGRGDDGYRYLARVTRELMWQQLSDDQLRYLARLPISQDIVLDQRVAHLYHATPRDAMDEYLGPDEKVWQERVAGLYGHLLCVGHTHLPFVLTLGDRIVLNPGSVGQPRDGDPRASYAVIEDGQIQLHRIEYRVDLVVDAIRATDWPERAKEWLVAVLEHGGLRPALARFQQ